MFLRWVGASKEDQCSLRGVKYDLASFQQTLILVHRARFHRVFVNLATHRLRALRVANVSLRLSRVSQHSRGRLFKRVKVRRVVDNLAVRVNLMIRLPIERPCHIRPIRSTVGAMRVRFALPRIIRFSFRPRSTLNSSATKRNRYCGYVRGRSLRLGDFVAGLLLLSKVLRVPGP